MFADPAERSDVAERRINDAGGQVSNIDHNSNWRVLSPRKQPFSDVTDTSRTTTDDNRRKI
jgi:hypothetical protein